MRSRSSEFVLGSYTTALEPEELLVEVRFPAAPAELVVLRAHPAAQRLRRAGDRGDRESGRRRVRGGGSASALAGVDDQPLLATEAARLLEGSSLDDDAIACRGRGRPRRRSIRPTTCAHRPSTVATSSASTSGACSETSATRQRLVSDTVEVTLRVNGRSYRRRVEPRLHLADFLRHELGPDRDAHRLRAGRLRQLHGHARRRRGQVVPDVRGAGRRPRGDDGRSARPRRWPFAATAAVQGRACAAMRLLHCRASS